jgi:hypothetical protein
VVADKPEAAEEEEENHERHELAAQDPEEKEGSVVSALS